MIFRTEQQSLDAGIDAQQFLCARFFGRPKQLRFQRIRNREHPVRLKQPAVHGTDGQPAAGCDGGVAMSLEEFPFLRQGPAGQLQEIVGQLRARRTVLTVTVAAGSIVTAPSQCGHVVQRVDERSTQADDFGDGMGCQEIRDPVQVEHVEVLQTGCFAEAITGDLGREKGIGQRRPPRADVVPLQRFVRIQGECLD